MLKIGISACFMGPDLSRPFFKTKTLIYIEQSMAHWVLSQDSKPFRATPWMIPPVHPQSSISLEEMVNDLDGLILHGGADIAPQTYGETPLKPEWAGDAPRDAYETALFQVFRSQGKPVLGICRGAQLINVALGGTLYQDIPSHRDPAIYDLNCHWVNFQPGSYLNRIYPNLGRGRVTSIHHQGIKTLAKNLVPEAYSDSDQMIEAFRLEDPSFIVGLQWHPEFHDPKRQGEDILSSAPLLQAFLQAAEKLKPKQRKN